MFKDNIELLLQSETRGAGASNKKITISNRSGKKILIIKCKCAVPINEK